MTEISLKKLKAKAPQDLIYNEFGNTKMDWSLD